MYADQSQLRNLFEGNEFTSQLTRNQGSLPFDLLEFFLGFPGVMRNFEVNETINQKINIEWPEPINYKYQFPDSLKEYKYFTEFTLNFEGIQTNLGTNTKRSLFRILPSVDNINIKTVFML